MPERNPLVLIVDPDAAVRDALLFAMRLEGINARLHQSARDLLHDPALVQAGCVVSAHDPGRLDGIALVGELRGRGIGVPAILMPDRCSAALRRAAQAAGVALLIEKPLLGNELRDSIRRLLGVG